MKSAAAYKKYNTIKLGSALRGAEAAKIQMKKH